MNTQKRYPREVRERAVRMVLEHKGEYDSQGAAIGSVATKLGMTAEMLRKWVRQSSGSSRSARCCRSPLPPTMPRRPAPRQPGNSATRSSHPRSSASTRRINPSTAPARYGGNSGDRDSRWPVARSSASCALWRTPTPAGSLVGRSGARRARIWPWPRTDLALRRRGGDVDGLTINGLYKTEVIRKRGPWKTLKDVEFATLEWVDWFNNRWLLEYTGYIPPAEFEEMYYCQQRLVEDEGLKQMSLQ